MREWSKTNSTTLPNEGGKNVLIISINVFKLLTDDTFPSNVSSSLLNNVFDWIEATISGWSCLIAWTANLFQIKVRIYFFQCKVTQVVAHVHNVFVNSNSTYLESTGSYNSAYHLSCTSRSVNLHENLTPRCTAVRSFVWKKIEATRNSKKKTQTTHSVLYAGIC